MESPLSNSSSSTDDRTRVIRSKAELRSVLAEARLQQGPIGLVPTMGALHEGHLSLLGAARGECDLVVMSLFVNPAQFGPNEDFDQYPRDEQRDLELASASGVDIVYAPAAGEIYPEGFSTRVEVDGLSGVLCGDHSRRGSGHFRGVSTVVAKLFNTIQPDLAYFGQKDAQQVSIIRRMVRDLDIPVQVRVIPTVREPDGLAISSRNRYLDQEDRRRAAALSRALGAAEQTAETAGLDAALATARLELAAAGIEPEYLEARDAENLFPVTELNGRPVLVAVAAQIGGARLIDNILIKP
jgi:pantoate--beta-alanine ligase